MRRAVVVGAVGVVAVLGLTSCGTPAPRALPPPPPPRIADAQSVPVDAAPPPVDAAPPDADPAITRAQAEADAHAACVKRKSAKDPPPVLLAAKPQKKPTPQVAITEVGDFGQRFGKRGGIPIHGKWTGETILRQLDKRLTAKLQFCYRDALARDPSIHGGIVMQIEWDDAGAVDSARTRTHQNLTGDAKLAACVTDHFNKLKLDARDAFGFLAFVEIAFCSGERGACLIAVDGVDETGSQIAALRSVEDRAGACYRAAGKSRGRGMHAIRAEVQRDGSLNKYTSPEFPFPGHDAALDCTLDALGTLCLEPAPVDTTFELTARYWYQR